MVSAVWNIQVVTRRQKSATEIDLTKVRKDGTHEIDHFEKLSIQHGIHGMTPFSAVVTNSVTSFSLLFSFMVTQKVTPWKTFLGCQLPRGFHGKVAFRLMVTRLATRKPFTSTCSKHSG